MSGLPRPTSIPHVLELTRRLAEHYDAVPLREVSRIVQVAAETATGPDGFTGSTEGMSTLIDAIERVARDDLDALVASQSTSTASKSTSKSNAL